MVTIMDLATALLELADGPREGYEYMSPWYAECITHMTDLFTDLATDITALQVRATALEAAMALQPALKVTSLPTAGAAYYGKLYILEGGLLGNDTLHICARLLNIYTWKSVTLL